MFREDDLREERTRAALDRSARSYAFTRYLALPDGREREQAGEYRPRESDVRILATVGAFRIIPRHELEQLPAPQRDLERLRQERLLSTTPYMVGRRRTTIVTLTREGLALLEKHRLDCRDEERQAFYSGATKTKEIAHDSSLYGAYRQVEKRLEREGLKVRRVVLEQQLKSDYQRFLQEPNRGRTRSSGRPRPDREAVVIWAAERDLPIIEGSVRFPDVRVEYERPDGTLGREDLEVVTENYRGAHAAATAAAGFTCHSYSAAKVRGARSSKRGGRARDARLAEEMFR